MTPTHMNLTASLSNTDLRPLWDETVLCANPDKGWYHHYYDNGTDKYLLESDGDLLSFPGMDHIYVRLSWRHFEPEEGCYDWHWIDDLAEKWLPRGLRMSVRVSCKETNEPYATPKWVQDAGAKGQVYTIQSQNNEHPPQEVWVPQYSDPVFLEKLEAFHRAFAARYDHESWLVYVDIGSMGTWGEGHEWPAGTPATVDEIRRHLDLHLDCYRHTPLVVPDEMAHFDRPPEQEHAIRALVDEPGICWRDDTPLLGYFLRIAPKTHSVVRPAYFEDSYRQRPVILETDHYPIVKRQGNWRGANGSEFGADDFRGALRLMHATYIGYHGSAREWLQDNPDLAVELANLCGYWYFPLRVTCPREENPGSSFPLSLTWMNRGVAPAYHRYEMHLRLQGPVALHIPLRDSDNREWMPEIPRSESFSLKIPVGTPPGTYTLSIQLLDPRSGRWIRLGLRSHLVSSDGFHSLGQKLQILQCP